MRLRQFSSPAEIINRRDAWPKIRILSRPLAE